MRAKIISNARIAQILGKGNPKQSIISSAAIVFTSFFYVFTIGSYFRLPIYFLHSRVVTKLYFTDVYIISKYVDHILIVSATVLWLIFSVRGNKARFAAAIIYGGIAAAGILSSRVVLVDVASVISIPLVICFLIYNKLASKKILNSDTNLSVNYFSITGIVIGVVSAVILSALPLFSVSSTPIPNYAYAIFVLFSSFSPILVILLINAVPVKVLTLEFIRSISKLNHVTMLNTQSSQSQSSSSSSSILSLSIPHYKVKLRNKVIYLSLILILTLTLVSIPHFPTVNKNNKVIGADSKNYVDWQNILMNSRNAQDFIRNAFVTIIGDRPITLILFFTTIRLTSADPLFIIDHLPLILGPALVLVIYFLTRELTSNDVVALFASFLTSVSFHTLVGLYAGYYANWLALIIGYLSFVFIFRFLKSSKKLYLAIYFVLTILVMFTHNYTWTILTIVTSIFLLVMLGLTSFYPRKSLILLLIAISCSVIIDLAKVNFTGSLGGIEQDIAIARGQEVGVGQLPVRWNNLIDTTQIYYGAAFSNVIILALGLYWLFRSNIKDPFNILLLIFLSIGIFPLFFGNWLVQSRVFYNIPFQIPAAISLAYIKREKYGTMKVLPICIWLIAMSIRTVSNFSF